jgi:hypothetical protein
VARGTSRGAPPRPVVDLTIVLDEHQVEQRKATIAAKLEDLGDVSALDSPRARRRRLIDLRAVAPGADLPALALFQYREAFERRAGSWQLIAYGYEFHDRIRGGRRAYHWHDDSFHAHCLEPDARGASHYRAVPMEVFEAHDEFARIYLSGGPIRCGDLRPALTADAIGKPVPVILLV